VDQQINDRVQSLYALQIQCTVLVETHYGSGGSTMAATTKTSCVKHTQASLGPVVPNLFADMTSTN